MTAMDDDEIHDGVIFIFFWIFEIFWEWSGRFILKKNVRKDNYSDVFFHHGEF